MDPLLRGNLLSAGPLRLPTPLSLAKSNLTDPSPFCRHLMLLTESSAALRLLFECGLLKQDRTVVLVGSQFPRDANSELRMVRQINEVKRAMQNGHTVVLVNHEGIFPSLYDVLNMRYTTKRSSDTGKVTRMLRLAVGNRSQWCSVGDGFKIVVVVEAKDAYEKLDLPLLNRFEKQVLRAEDVLETDEAKQLLQELEKWMEDVEERTRVRDPFVGLYGQTLASLVHCQGLLDRSESNLTTMKNSLSALLSPLARIRGALGAQNNSDVGDCVATNVFDEIDRCLEQRKHLLVLTFSSAHGFETLLAGMRRDNAERAARYGESIALGGVTSEREFVLAMKQGLRNKARIVQCDPNITPQETIEHARYLAVQELAKDEIAVFIVHLPPGGPKQRRFNVDFQTRWKAVFIDDVSRPDFMSVVNTSPIAWADQQNLEGMRNMERVIRTKLSTILTKARPPLGEGVAILDARERMQQVLHLLSDPVFVKSALDGTTRDVLRLMRPDEHVELVAQGIVRAGTIADSLNLALEVLVVQSFALAMRWYDINFNLALRTSSNDRIRTLWEVLCNPPTPEFLASDFASLESSHNIRNSGRPGYPLVSKFPWSWRVYEVFEQALVGKKGSAASSKSSSSAPTEQLLAGIADVAFGPKFLYLADCFIEEYLYDVCGFQVNRRPEISLQEQTQIVRSWIGRRTPTALKSLPAVHVALHEQSWAIFSLLSMRVILCELQFPDDMLRFDETNEPCFKRLCEFLLSDKALSHPRWSSCVASLATKMHDLFLLDDGVEVQRMWADILFRRAYAVELVIAPSAVPTNLLDPATCLTKQDVFVSSWRTDPHEFFLEAIARDVLGKQWFHDELFMLEMLRYAATATNSRETRLCLLEAVFRHEHWMQSKQLVEFFFSVGGSPLLTLALDLAEDIPGDPNASRQDLFPLDKAVMAAREREQLKDFVLGERTEDVDLAQSVPARAFALNHLLAKYGDLGAAQRIKESSHLLKLFRAPERFLHALKGGENDAKGNTVNGQKQRTIESIQKGNSFSLLLGEKVFREATDILLKHMTMTTKEEGETEGDEAVRRAIKQSKQEHYSQMYQGFFRKLSSTAAKSDIIKLWSRQLSCDLEASFPVFIVVLLAAAAGKTFTDQMALTYTGIPVFLKELISVSDSRWWPGNRRNTDERLFLYLVDLVCGLHTEQCWRAILYEGNITEQDRLVMLLSVMSGLLVETDVRASYLGELLRGRLSSQYFLPGMLEGELAEITRALGYVGWWECPQGHRYAVGECTMPMQQSRCPECGAPVGGQDHNPVKGVKRLNDLEDGVGSQPGYRPIADLHAHMDPVRNLFASGLAFYQLIFHAVTLVALQGPSGNQVRHFLVSTIQNRREQRTFTASTAAVKCEKYFRTAWTTLRESSLPSFATKSDHELFYAALLSVVVRDPHFRFAIGGDASHLVENHHRRVEMESCLQSVIRLASVETELVMQRLTEVQQLLGTALQKMELTQLVTNEVLMEAEFQMSNDSESTQQMSNNDTNERILWRYRTPVAFLNLAATLDGPNCNEYVFLKRFCRIESRLGLVVKLADILEWINVLYEALSLRKHRISRDEAVKLSNVCALETLPVGRREYAQEVLARFCDAFNETFVFVPNLYECQRNPFLTEEPEPRVDLSGGRGLQAGNRTEMSPDTPVSFSLCAIVQGDADAQSLCLFQLIRTLQQLNNTVLEELGGGGGGRGGRNEHAAAGRGANPMLMDVDFPVTTMFTPKQVVVSRLINYQRNRDLLPILATTSAKSFGLGHGVMRTVNLAACSRALEHRLLAGKQPLQVVIPSFEYAGEARRTGTLAGLRTRVPQEQLNRSVQFSITAELDTDSRIQPLWEVVDAAVGFLSGFVGFNGETLLGDFAQNVLGVERQRWEEISPQPVQQHVRLCHLAALYALLEEAKNGSPLDSVRDKYKTPLPAGMEVELKMIASKMDLDTLLPILKELLTARLSEDTFPEDALLAEYLEYCTDLDLSSLGWFKENFPVALTLSHAYHCWRTLVEVT